MLNVFISYSTQDIDYVNKVQACLDQLGKKINIFRADKSIPPGKYLAEEISTAIHKCNLFILFWSENAESSKWVPLEVGKAHSLNKDIVPLILTKNLQLPPFILGIRYIPLYKNPIKGFNQLIRLVNDKSYNNGAAKKAIITGGIIGTLSGLAYFVSKKLGNKKNVEQADEKIGIEAD